MQLTHDQEEQVAAMIRAAILAHERSLHETTQPETTNPRESTRKRTGVRVAATDKGASRSQ